MPQCDVKAKTSSTSKIRSFYLFGRNFQMSTLQKPHNLHGFLLRSDLGHTKLEKILTSNLTEGTSIDGQFALFLGSRRIQMVPTRAEVTSPQVVSIYHGDFHWTPRLKALGLTTNVLSNFLK